MPVNQQTLRTCLKGHQYYKSSDCPTCPFCEMENKPTEGFLAFLAAPARRALLAHGISTLKKLSSYSEKEILAFHGMGRGSMPVLKKAMAEKGLAFRKKDR